MGQGPYFCNASICIFVKYPLCTAKPYWGYFLSYSTMRRSRVTFAMIEAALTQAATGWIRRPEARDPGSRRAPGPAATEGGDG